MSWLNNFYYKLNIKDTLVYFMGLTTKYHFASAIFGFFLFITIISQLFSGIMLSFSLVPECMLIPVIRDEEDLDDLYTDDFFWLHERGVDLIFIISYLHLLRKLYLNIFYFEQEMSWKSGVFSFIIIHVVTFFGLILCCTHLSDVTLSIAANIIHTFFFYFKGKFYWWIFTDKKLNTDTIIRAAYLHYILAFYLFFLGFFHAIDMHYDWKQDVSLDGIETELVWWDESFSNEISSMFDFFVFLFVICLYMYSEPEALSYEIFMWGDVGLVTDVRFYGVAPHWYFRPYMAWLTVCPMHVNGIFGIFLFLFSLYHQPSLSGARARKHLKSPLLVTSSDVYKVIDPNAYSIDISFLSQMLFFVFVMSLLYCSSFLPSGRYYQRVYGNNGMLFSFFYVFFYLIFFNTKKPLWFHNFFYKCNYKTSGLRRFK